MRCDAVIAVPIISRHSFKGRDFDMTSYVWSSNADELLLEWDLMLELYDRGFGLVRASCPEFCLSSACVLHVLTRVAVASGSPSGIANLKSPVT